MNKNIIVIGSGWLGSPLSKALAQSGHKVTATTTSTDKLAPLNEQGFDLILLNSQKLIQQDQAMWPQINADLMIITIPPQRGQTDYFEQLKVLAQLALNNKVRQLLFISSSSVWANCHGMITEQTTANPMTATGQAMVNFSQWLHQSALDATTLHLTGLINEQRHPGHFLAGKSALSQANAAVNLIHQQDCIGLIERIIDKQYWGHQAIGCAPSHPSRREFYIKAAQRLGLEPPTFNDAGIVQQENDTKIINAQATATALDYHYQISDLIKWLHST
ncbi:hypothetical protein CW748_03830 [Alteromonadales bacterium alter-6D02]|nr:hypothetical protein CW748_03830 [Alteromonadales bacterium alter-6D02]